jgi:hypothetical protein
VKRYMDQYYNDHQNAGPDMNITPGMALEKNSDAVIRISASLVTAYRQVQKVNSGY